MSYISNCEYFTVKSFSFVKLMQYYSMEKKAKIMRALILTLLFGIISNICYSQTDVKITEKRNLYNDKGDYYFDRNEFKKAIVFYTMAYQKNTSDYYSILKKADAYTKLKLYLQAEECYRIVFERKMQIDNVFRLNYAYILLENNKPEQFKNWIGMYSEIVEEEIEGENYLISSENRIKLYKDSTIILGRDKLDTINFKIKYEGYHYRRRASAEDDKISVIVSNGDEYHIDAIGNNFVFSFHPMANYKIIIQKENIIAEEIINNKEISIEQRGERFLNPPSVQKAEIIVPPGMKYQFSVGQSAISQQYKSDLNEKIKSYQNPNENTINLTVLAKELHFEEGEIYTFRFVKDDNQVHSYKGKEVSSLIINDKAISIFGQSFFLLLPLNTEANFNIQTDIDAIEQDYSSKKYGLIIDDGPVFKKEEESAKWLISLTVNTDSIEEVKAINSFSAKEISIIPGTTYILTLSKPDPIRKRDLEIIVPLTKGVKYNLGSTQESNTEFKEALAEFLTGRENLEPTNEEVIDISILSKELEVQPGEDLSFHLLPAKQYGKKPAVAEVIKSSLMLDGKVFEISSDKKYTINIPFNVNRKVNFQTDLNYLQENFESDDYTLRLDTISFTSEITVDTTGYGNRKSSGWLSMSVNTDLTEEVDVQNQLIALEVSIIPGKEYILTVSKVDADTGEEEEIIIPLLRKVKYDFTSNPTSEEEYKLSLEKFLSGRKDIETIDGTLIDITLLSKELKIKEGDEVSFSLLPVRKLSKEATNDDNIKSSLYLDNKIVEFTQIQKYTINMPLNNKGQMNIQTNLEHIQENFDPASITLDVDTTSFFSEIIIDTTGLGDRVIKDEKITDPVFDVITVNFDLNEHLLKSDAKKIIQVNVIDELKIDSRLYVTIKGYTDALGDTDYNLKLSKKRAESVQEFLRKNNIGEGRIRTFSFGESQALKEGVNWEDLDEEELKKHRKVEIVIYLPK